MSARPESARTYGQWCPIAVGLDLLGDRWVLLIVRELALGDRRFTDLRTALPGLAPNLLSDRLKHLREHGLVTAAELPPPAARTVYRLTGPGQEALPVLRALARFGAGHLDGPAGAAFDARRAAHSLVVPWRRPVELTARVRLVLEPGGSGGEPTETDVVLAGQETRVERPRPDHPADATVTTTADALARARRERRALRPRIAGDRSVAAAFLAVFDLAGG